MALLSFYTGLRRNEVRYLRVCDVVGIAHPYLFVRNTSSRRLKTSFSQRKLPLPLLLPKRWLRYVMAWVRRRRLQCADRADQSLLFSIDAAPLSPLPENTTIDVIRDALREVTGDERLVFQHLRHSFANWQLVRLMAPDWPGLISSSLHAMDAPYFSRETCLHLRHALFHQVRANAQGDIPDVPVREALHQLAELMGHASPDVTLVTYLHLINWMLSGCRSVPGELHNELNVVRPLVRMDADKSWYRIRKMFARDDGESRIDAAALARWTRARLPHRLGGLWPPQPLAPQTDDRKTKRKAMATDVSLKRVHQLLAFVLTDPTDRLASAPRVFDLPREIVAALWQRFEVLTAEGHALGNRKKRTPRIPNLRLRQDQADFDRVDRHFVVCKKAPDDTQHRNADVLAHTERDGFRYFRCAEVETAATMQDILRTLLGGNVAIAYRQVPCDQPDVDDASAISRWANTVHVNETVIATAPPWMPRRHWRETQDALGWLDMWPVFTAEPNHSGSRSFGIRYGLFLCAVAWAVNTS